MTTSARPAGSLFARILISRAARSFAYGALAVVLADALAARGFAPIAIGALVSCALMSGAALSACTGALVHRFGVRVTLIASGTAMAVAALLLSASPIAAVLACVLGVVSPGGQDVGPFAAVEHAMLAHGDTALNRRFAWYNVTSGAALAVGALFAGAVSPSLSLGTYAAAGIVAATIGSTFSAQPFPRAPATARRASSFGTVERLVTLFALDAFAGGFVVQAFLAYWFALRFDAGPHTIGPLLFGANALATISYLLAERLASRIGLLRTMVFTHLPSNVLLCLVPLMPTLPLAAAVLLARFALSQMDVPARQAYTMLLVPAHARTRAAGLAAAVRPAAASVAPFLTGLAFQTATLGIPFVVAGGIKIVYDLTLLAMFRSVPPAEERAR